MGIQPGVRHDGAGEKGPRARWRNSGRSARPVPARCRTPTRAIQRGSTSWVHPDPREPPRADGDGHDLRWEWL